MLLQYAFGPLCSSDLIALDLEKEQDAIEAKRNELLEGSQESQEAIRKHLSEAKDHFHEVAKRIKQIETEPLKALPSEDPAKIKEINDSRKECHQRGRRRT